MPPKKSPESNKALPTTPIKTPIKTPKTPIISSPYGDIPKIIPDADIINADPEEYINNKLSNIEDLRRMVDIASYLYHNYETSSLTDNTYECLEYFLKKAEKKLGNKYDRIGAPVIDRIRKELTYQMASLEKIKPDSKKCIHFLSELDRCVWSVKLDGVSGLAIYKKGVLVELNTRGDGKYGGDVSELIKYINIPQTIETQCDIFVVRGEFVISFEKFQKYKLEYANPRAFVSGKVNSGFISDGLNDIDFVAYELVDWDMPTLPKISESLMILANKGFITVKHQEVFSPLLFTIITIYKEQKANYIYLCDGLVLTMNYPRQKTNTSQAPSYSKAFKMTLETQIRHTQVTDIEWNITRYGRYFPKVIYKPVYVDGVRLTKATGHNANHIKKWSMGKGTEIDIIRSGHVIPQIKDIKIDTSITPIYPTSFPWHWSGLDIVLDDIEPNKFVQIKRIVHFFKVLGLKQFGQKTAEKMYEHGLVSAEDIIKSSVSDFMKIKQVGKVKANNYYNDIHTIMKQISPAKLMSASSVFNCGVGKNLLTILFRKVPTILDMSESDIINWFSKNKLPGFGPAKIKSAAKNIPEFRAYLESFAKSDISDLISHHINKVNDLNNNGCNKEIKGKKFVFTGFFNDTDDFEEYIIDNEGSLENKVSEKITALITGDIQHMNTKMTAAVKYNIPIYTLKEFSERYNIPIIVDDVKDVKND